jgi:hypothetical protein
MDTPAKARNKDLQKTKLCCYFLQGNCGLGAKCQFAHDVSEIRKAPDLAKTQLCTKWLNGNCANPNCSFAHGEAELQKPPNFKKKMCAWFKDGRCRNGAKCGFAHSLSELYVDAEPPGDSQTKPWKAGSEYDFDASTIAPSSASHQSSRSTMASDISRASTASVPEEHLFRMMAGRGSAPLQDQVASMTLAIGDLQAKLARFEDMAAKSQVGQLRQSIDQLTEQCGDMEAQLLKTNQPAPSSTVTSAPVRGNAAPPAQPGLRARPSSSAASEPKESITKKALQLPGRKTYPNAQAVRLKPSGIQRGGAEKKWWDQYGLRAALALLTISLMALLELHVNQ